MIRPASARCAAAIRGAPDQRLDQLGSPASRSHRPDTPTLRRAEPLDTAIEHAVGGDLDHVAQAPRCGVVDRLREAAQIAPGRRSHAACPARSVRSADAQKAVPRSIADHQLLPDLDRTAGRRNRLGSGTPASRRPRRAFVRAAGRPAHAARAAPSCRTAAPARTARPATTAASARALSALVAESRDVDAKHLGCKHRAAVRAPAMDTR